MRDPGGTPCRRKLDRLGLVKRLKRRDRPVSRLSSVVVDGADCSFSHDEVVWSGLQAGVWRYG